MSRECQLFTRREFLKSSAIAGAGLALLPSFLTQSAFALEPGNGGRVLVVVQLGGGNDGLNTVVPFENDAYYRARKNLSIKKAEVLPLADGLGLHGSLEGLRALYDGGQLAIVNGAGYPNPDRSHFRSMEIWQTAVDSNRFSKTGWIGRYFDNCCGGRPDALAGVAVDGESPQAFSSASGAGVAFQQPENFRWVEGNGGDTPGAFEAINRVSAPQGSNLEFLRHVTANAIVSSDRVRKAAAKGSNRSYPNSALGRNMEHIAKMIAGGLSTRIYYTSISGFDTHSGQAGPQANLLRQFSEAMTAFLQDLKKMGAQNRVLVMCFSEFGRRVEENASRGTDHGTAGPMFLLGSGIRPGLHGSYPSLTDLDEGDLKYTVDFRAVYKEVLENWMQADTSKVIAGDFKAVGVVA